MENQGNFDNFFNEESDEVTTKIPYDDVPIQRGGYRHDNRRVSYDESRSILHRIKGSSPKSIVFVYFLIAVLIISNIVMGSFLYRLSESKSDNNDVSIVNYTGDIYSSNNDIQLASSRAFMSTCSVLATTSALSSLTEQEFSAHSGSGGSGIILDIDTIAGALYVVTNYHVIYNSELANDKFYNYIYVLLPDMSTPILMDVLGGTINYDIAVLKVNSEYVSYVKQSSSKAVDFRDSSSIYLGESVIAVGNSRAAGLQVTSGVISLEEEIMSGRIAGKDVNLMLLRHSAEINGGNSGGGLFDKNGKLIGLVNGRYSSGSTVYSSDNVIQGMNYAVPSSIVSSIAKNIINDSIVNTASSVVSLQRPDIGLFTTKIKYNTSGIEKNLLFNNKRFSLASDSSLQINYSTVVGNVSSLSPFNTGDVILSFKYNDTVVECNKMFSLESHIYNFRNGDEVTFYVEREGVSGVVEIVLPISTFIAIA